jgi:hypothetical protein
MIAHCFSTFCRSTPLEFNFGAVKIGGQANSPLFEAARVLVHLDHVSNFIVNPNRSAM